MSANGQTPEARLRRLEATMPPAPCPRCKGQAWSVVIDPEPMPERPCPACGCELHIVHIVCDEEGPQ